MTGSGIRNVLDAVAGSPLSKLIGIVAIVLVSVQGANDYLNNHYAQEPRTSDAISALQCSTMQNASNYQIGTLQVQIQIAQVQLNEIERIISEHHGEADDATLQLRDARANQLKLLSKRYEIALRNMPAPRCAEAIRVRGHGG